MNNKNLIDFINFTKELLLSLQERPNERWFFELFDKEIVNHFFSKVLEQDTLEKFQSITDSDINRIKAYLNFIDKRAYNYGRIFYQDIQNNNLKVSLIKDYKEMKIALANGDIIEFGRRLSLQLENIFNFSLKSLNIHNLISKNEQYFKALKPKWGNYTGDAFNFYKSFFFFNNYTGKWEPVELSKVSFKTKSIFLSIHFNYTISSLSVNEMYFLRNKGSHREQLSSNDRKTLERIISNFDKNYSFYHKVLFDVVNGITNLR